MGIKNFMKLIYKTSPSSIIDTNITKYQNKVLGIDANLMIYKMINAIRQNGYDIKNDDIIVTHIHTLILKLVGFIKYNITPVFVFDGKAPLIKAETLKKRIILQEATEKKYNDALTEYEKLKFYMRYNITDKELNECKQLIKLFDYTIIDAIEEADSQLVELLNCNKIDYIVTDDMDILIFGGKNILKNFSVSSKKKIQEIDLNKFKQDTGLSQKMIIDIAILMGCDYCTNAYGVGPMKSYKLIKKYNTIDNLVKKKHIDFIVGYHAASEYFLNPPVTKCIEFKKWKYGKNINKVMLTEFLKRFLFKDEYINKLFTKLTTN
jgi:flap endonuclease-1